MTFCTLTLLITIKRKKKKKKHATPKPSDCPSLMITNHLLYLVAWGGRGGGSIENLFLSLISAPAIWLLLLLVLFCVVGVIVRYVWWPARFTCNSSAITLMCILKQLLSTDSIFGHIYYHDWYLCISDSVLCAVILKFDETRFTNVRVSCFIGFACLFFKGLK